MPSPFTAIGSVVRDSLLPSRWWGRWLVPGPFSERLFGDAGGVHLDGSLRLASAVRTDRTRSTCTVLSLSPSLSLPRGLVVRRVSTIDNKGVCVPLCSDVVLWAAQLLTKLGSIATANKRIQVCERA